MLNIADVEAVFLDHSYCKKIVFDVEFQPDLMASKAQKMADNWEEVGFEFQPPGPSSDLPLSALSPAHSIDSGFDNEMNLFGEMEGIDGIDLDSVMESIFNTDMNSNISNQKGKTLKTVAGASTQPTTTVTAASVKTKALDEMNDVEKSRKNAIAARENRLKKKKYVEDIEKELEQLRKENEALKAKDRRHSQDVEKLKNEVSYLRNVIANQSTLSVLLERLVTTPGINFTTNLAPLDPEERPIEDKNDADVVIDDDDDDEVEPPPQSKNCKEKIRDFIQTRYHTRGNKRSASSAESSSGRKKARNDEVKGGVCLHVGQDKVSLAFCSQCSLKASGNKQH